MMIEDSVKNAWMISRSRKFLLLLFCFAGGTLYSAALPPLNFSLLIFVSLLPLLYCATAASWKFSLLCGWVWGLGWSLFSYQFLREIEWFIPFLISPVLAVWPALWAAFIPMVYKVTLFPPESVLWKNNEKQNYLKKEISPWRILFFAVSAAVWFTIVEWSRSRLFVWNDLSVTQWRNSLLIQISALTGSYGIGFLIVLINVTVFSVLIFRRRAAAAISLTVLLLSAALIYGSCRIGKFEKLPPAEKSLKAALIQPDLSQRRHSTVKEAVEAVDVCVELSEKVCASEAEVIIWPESAVPIPLRSSGEIGAYFRNRFINLLNNGKKPVLAGMLDFKKISGNSSYAVTNSALMFDSKGKNSFRYDKIHRVPFGEYVPFRKYIPQFITRAIDMGRDLHPGNNYEPAEVKPGIRAATAICYEGVFGYLMRKLARKADLFIVISNDAWYPESSEPEQHLANAVIRCTENGMFMIRCGNNGGSGVVTPIGKFTQYIGSRAPRPELLRERAYGMVEVPVYGKELTETFFLKYGEIFIMILALYMFALIFHITVFYFKQNDIGNILTKEK